jgi:hypothetical protein
MDAAAWAAGEEEVYCCCAGGGGYVEGEEDQHILTPFCVDRGKRNSQGRAWKGDASEDDGDDEDGGSDELEDEGDEQEDAEGAEYEEADEDIIEADGDSDGDGDVLDNLDPDDLSKQLGGENARDSTADGDDDLYGENVDLEVSRPATARRTSSSSSSSPLRAGHAHEQAPSTHAHPRPSVASSAAETEVPETARENDGTADVGRQARGEAAGAAAVEAEKDVEHEEKFVERRADGLIGTNSTCRS